MICFVVPIERGAHRAKIGNRLLLLVSTVYKFPFWKSEQHVHKNEAADHCRYFHERERAARETPSRCSECTECEKTKANSEEKSERATSTAAHEECEHAAERDDRSESRHEDEHASAGECADLGLRATLFRHWIRAH